MKIIDSGIQSKVIKIRHWVIVLVFLSKKKKCPLSYDNLSAKSLYFLIIWRRNAYQRSFKHHLWCIKQGEWANINISKAVISLLYLFAFHYVFDLI